MRTFIQNFSSKEVIVRLRSYDKFKIESFKQKKKHTLIKPLHNKTYQIRPNVKIIHRN